MQTQQDRLRLAVSWLTPSVSELIIYIIISIFTLIVSNISFVRSFIYAPKDFNIINLVLNSISYLLNRFVGVGTTRTVVVVVFWALIGLLVYSLIWVFGSFSDELGNDLALTKYVHPRNVDTSSPLRLFLYKTLFRLMILIIGIFYLVIFWKALLPFVMNNYRSALAAWPKLGSLRAGLVGMVVQIIGLHAFIVLARLLFLKKRIFD